jgi:hypothetical protein
VVRECKRRGEWRCEVRVRADLVLFVVKISSSTHLQLPLKLRQVFDGLDLELILIDNPLLDHSIIVTSYGR